MSELEKVMTFKNQSGTAIVTLYKLGEVNHIVQLARVNCFPPIQKEILCLSFEHAKHIFDKCKEEVEANGVVQ